MMFEKQVVDVVNPQRRDLIVYYPGPAYDIVNPLKTTQGSRFVFVDTWDPAYGTIDQQLQRIQQDIKSGGGKVRKFLIILQYSNLIMKIDIEKSLITSKETRFNLHRMKCQMDTMFTFLKVLVLYMIPST